MRSNMKLVFKKEKLHRTVLMKKTEKFKVSENEKFGSPIKSGVIDSIPTNQYRFNSANSDVPVYSFTKNVDGLNLDFDLVSTGFNDSSIIEETPQAGLPFKIIHRDDGKGSASNAFERGWADGGGLLPG